MKKKILSQEICNNNFRGNAGGHYPQLDAKLPGGVDGIKGNVLFHKSGRAVAPGEFWKIVSGVQKNHIGDD